AHHAVHHESFALPENDDGIGLELSGVTAPDGNLIAWPKHGNHAGPGDPEMNLAGDTSELGDQVAARCLEVHLALHAGRATRSSDCGGSRTAWSAPCRRSALPFQTRAHDA